MNALQLLAVALAMISVLGFGQAGRLLGEEGRGWPTAPIGVSIALEVLAMFWIAAAVFAAGHARIVGPLTLTLAAAFALGAVISLVHVVRRRPGRWMGGPR